MSPSLQTGDHAPDFSMPSDTKGDISLSDLKGKIVVLYFYPKDDTPGCTQEAIDFSKKQDQFNKLDALVIGVSRDSLDKHKKFAAKHNLNVVLASDTEAETLQKYGVWVEKSMFGKKYMGIERATFLIDREGRLAKIWRKVKVKGHADAVLKAAQAL